MLKTHPAVFVCLVACVFAAATRPSPSATVTPTNSVTPTPVSASISPSVSPTTTVSPSVSPSPASVSITPTVTPSPYKSNTGRGCERDACIAGTCQSTNSRCCSGHCIDHNFVPKTIAIGATCDNAGTAAQTACTLCQKGLTCNTSNLCVAQGIGYGCTATCSSSADCVIGIACNSGRCGFADLGQGAPCSATNTCHAGLTCTSSVCTAIAHGGTCNVANQPYDPSSSLSDVAYLDGGCVKTDYCVSNVCTTRLANDNACTTDTECASGLCSSGFCTVKGSVASQEACTDHRACASGLYCSGTSVGSACEAKKAQGARCTQSSTWPYDITSQSASDLWCQTGLFCSKFDNVRPQCMPPLLKPGATCYNSDQCDGTLSSFGCLQTAPGVAGVCSGNSLNLRCYNNSMCGSGYTCGCSVTDGSVAGLGVCVPNGGQKDCTATEAALANAAFAGGYSQATDPIGMHGGFPYIAIVGGAISAKFICCQACIGSSYDLGAGEVSLYAAVFGRSFNCQTETSGAQWSGANQATVCAATGGQTGQTTALAASAFLNICVASTSPTPTISVSPSVSPSPGSGGSSSGGASAAASDGNAASGALALNPQQKFAVTVGAGAGGGGLLVIILIIVIVCCIRRKNKQKVAHLAPDTETGRGGK